MTLGPAASGIVRPSDSAILVSLHKRDLQVSKQCFLSKDLEESIGVRNIEERET